MEKEKVLTVLVKGEEEILYELVSTVDSFTITNKRFYYSTNSNINTVVDLEKITHLEHTYSEEIIYTWSLLAIGVFLILLSFGLLFIDPLLTLISIAGVIFIAVFFVTKKTLIKASFSIFIGSALIYFKWDKIEEVKLLALRNAIFIAKDRLTK